MRTALTNQQTLKLCPMATLAGPTPDVTCPRCPDRTFRPHQTMARNHHLRTHGLVMMWQCRICGKQWPTERYRHLARHSRNVHGAPPRVRPTFLDLNPDRVTPRSPTPEPSTSHPFQSLPAAIPPRGSHLSSSAAAPGSRTPAAPSVKGCIPPRGSQQGNTAAAIPPSRQPPRGVCACSLQSATCPAIHPCRPPSAHCPQRV